MSDSLLKDQKRMLVRFHTPKLNTDTEEEEALFEIKLDKICRDSRT